MIQNRNKIASMLSDRYVYFYFKLKTLSFSLWMTGSTVKVFSYEKNEDPIAMTFHVIEKARIGYLIGLGRANAHWVHDCTILCGFIGFFNEVPLLIETV